MIGFQLDTSKSKHSVGNVWEAHDHSSHLDREGYDEKANWKKRSNVMNLNQKTISYSSKTYGYRLQFREGYRSLVHNITP